MDTRKFSMNYGAYLGLGLIVISFFVYILGLEEQKSIVPLCMIGNKGLYINAEGKFKPCCWTALRYDHNKNIFNYINFNKTLTEVLDDSLWKTLFDDMSVGKGPRECAEKCSVKKWNLAHATSW